MTPIASLMLSMLLLIAAVQSESAKPSDPCGDLGKLPSIEGGSGNDRIYGSNRAYRLFGQKDRDFIIGSEGGEIIGGEDADTLVAYAGSDRFVYEAIKDSLPDRSGRWSPKTGDTIVDFRGADGDRIDLRRLQQSGADPSDSYEWTGTEPQPYSVWVSRRSGDTTVFVDVDGDTRADLVIRLLGNVRLSQSDFCGVQAAAS